MNTALLFLLLAGLPGHQGKLSVAQAQPDSTIRAAADSVKTTSAGLTQVCAQVRQATPPAIRLSGDIALATGFYATREPDASRAQSTPWCLSGNLTLVSRSGWSVPVRMVWSSQNSQYRQPYNQIGSSPTYKKWLTLHAGYRNVVFSPLTLAGHTFLGVGIELNPGLLRIGAVVGKFNRAINADYANPDAVPTFRRTGYSAKLGIGNERNYLDLILLRVADDVNSIRTDSLTRISPAENLVLGLSGRLVLAKKLYAELDAAGSAYTRNSQSEATTNPDKRFESMGLLKNIITQRQSTQLYTALQAAVSYRAKWADLKIQYKRIEPDYKSMGAYYFQNDIESFTVAPTLKLFKKRLNLRSSLGWQHDNLVNQKKARTDRLIGSVSVSYTSDKDLTLDLIYSNYGITQRAGYRSLNDTIRLAQNNRTLSGSLFKLWTGTRAMHTLTGSATYQELQDLNRFTAEQNENKNWNYNLSYAWQHLTANLDLNVSYSYSLSKALDMNSAYYGPSVSIAKRLLTNNALSLMTTVSYLQSHETLAEFKERGSVLTTALTVDYQLTPVHRLSMSWTNVLNRGSQTFHQQQGTIQYSATF